MVNAQQEQPAAWVLSCCCRVNMMYLLEDFSTVRSHPPFSVLPKMAGIISVLLKCRENRQAFIICKSTE